MSAIIAIRCRKHNRGEQARPLKIQQIAIDPENGRRATRELTASGKAIITSAWSYTARPFEPGLYCVHCLNEGRREPLDVDQQDLADLDLGEAPLVFQSASTVKVADLVESFRQRYPERVRDVHDLPPTEAVYADRTVFDRLQIGLRTALTRQLLGPDGKLYQFQAEAVATALDGHDLVVTTPTASGKTLTYTLPVLDALLRDRGATALYLSPLVALTEDQLGAVTNLDMSKKDWRTRGERFSIHRHLRTLELGAGQITVARYDGSVPQGDRQEIRHAQPQYLLTTPDMLHAAILNWGTANRPWSYLLAGLRYVVIDELHSYRGVMGAAFANLLRRLQRLCAMHGAHPRFLCASATMVDPAETVERFIGRRPVVIDGSNTGAPQHRRAFVLWSGERSEGSFGALSTQAKNVVLQLMDERVRTIAFARSISEINDIYRFAAAELKDQGYNLSLLQPFMRELLPEDKRRIITDLKEGRLQGVITTTALSMGIDIGNLSAAVIIGFPGSIAQLWQQSGRAGRSGEGLIVLIADNNPLDQFFVQHPDVLFDLRAEPVYLNPDNPYIVRGHLLQAAREAPLTEAEVALFGPSAAQIAGRMEAEGLLVRNPIGLLAISAALEQEAPIAFRNLTFSVPVLTHDTRQPVVEVDAARAQRALHRYAHYQHIDHYYEVTSCRLDWQQGQGEILVRELEHPEFTTTARISRNVAVLTEDRHGHGPGYATTFGTVHCHVAVDGYYRVPLYTRTDPFSFQPLGRAAPPPLDYETQALWLTFAAEWLDQFEPVEREAGLYSLAGALRLATAIVELCDPSDIESIGFVNHSDTVGATLMIYDSVPGGIGITESAFPRAGLVLDRAEQILADCPHCSTHPDSRGCPYCVTAQYGDETTINRHVALEIARMLRTKQP
jgi:DEAD/DEAH box helicase domain-containing protein